MTPHTLDHAAHPTSTLTARHHGLWHQVRLVLKPFASLQLTVVLFAFSLGLIFFGTLAQKTSGLWTVVDRYFWSWVVMVEVQPLIEFGKIFLGLPKQWQVPSSAAFPFPGGKLLGGLLFLNLVAAHTVRFRLSWRRAGVWVAHAGIMLLFIGEAITRECQVEQQISIMEGSSSNFAIDPRHYEIAIIDSSDPADDQVAVVSAERFRQSIARGERISHPDLPVDLEPVRYMPNSVLVPPADPVAGTNPADAQAGRTRVAVAQPEVSGVDTSESRDAPSAYVRFIDKQTGKTLGTYLLSLFLDDQPLTVGNTTYKVSLRNTHHYKPYSLRLNHFTYEEYPGTTMAKNYASEMTLTDAERGQQRDIVVSMNNPLRYRGETFYQHQFNRTPEGRGTVLQVVRNPAWFLPYIACTMVGAGLLFHFLLGLTQYLSRRKRVAIAGASVPVTWFERVLPLIVVGLGSLLIIGAAAPRSDPGKPDIREAARIPVVDGGRVKPLDTAARVYLRKISGREEFEGSDGRMHSALRWLLDVMSTTPASRSGVALDYKVIRIDNDQVRTLLHLERREGSRYSYAEVNAHSTDLQRAMDKARPRPGRRLAADADAEERVNRLFESGDRDVFAAQVMETGERFELYTRLLVRAKPLVIPPAGDADWRSSSEVENDAEERAVMAVCRKYGILPKDLSRITGEQREELLSEMQDLKARLVGQEPREVKFLGLLSAYRTGDQTLFDKALAEFRSATSDGVSPADLARCRFEVFLNEFAPAYQVIKLYAMALVLGFAGWVAMAIRPTFGESIRKSVFWLLVLTFVTHAFALGSRMYLMDRPLVLVTNLYSSAVFIGCAAVAVCLFIERVFPIGLGNVVAAVLGGGTAIIAHNLAAGGDTLEMMQAVLDTNFWLATHVTTVTLGYAATYVAGILGLVYIVVGVFTSLLRQPSQAAGLPTPTAGRGSNLGRILGSVTYGVICLATLLSFVGTVLGGIWADQSWGRFWGWDPKENGAVLIVLWNALILHARWCGLVKDRGVAVLALVGNMITTWSWFGTNQLGVGLHFYGFNNALAMGCTITWAVHLALIGLGLAPTRYWASFRTAPTTGPVRIPGPTLPVVHTSPNDPQGPNSTNGNHASPSDRHEPHRKGKKGGRRH